MEFAMLPKRLFLSEMTVSPIFSTVYTSIKWLISVTMSIFFFFIIEFAAYCQLNCEFKCCNQKFRYKIGEFSRKMWCRFDVRVCKQSKEKTASDYLEFSRLSVEVERKDTYRIIKVWNNGHLTWARETLRMAKPKLISFFFSYKSTRFCWIHSHCLNFSELNSFVVSRQVECNLQRIEMFFFLAHQRKSR